MVDGERWFRTAPVPPHLARVQDALWSDRRLRLRYRRGLDRVVDRTVEPYGLVCKAGTWYLLAGVEGRARVYRVSRIEDAELSEESFARPPDLNLREAWAAQVGRFRGDAPEHVAVTVRVDPDVSGRFTRLVGEQIIGRSADGVAILDFAARDAAVILLTVFGRAVEVLEPRDLREHLAELGRQLSTLYGGG